MVSSYTIRPTSTILYSEDSFISINRASTPKMPQIQVIVPSIPGSHDRNNRPNLPSVERSPVQQPIDASSTTSSLCTSIRNRACVLSESEISVLDLGPGLAPDYMRNSEYARLFADTTEEGPESFMLAPSHLTEALVPDAPLQRRRAKAMPATRPSVPRSEDSDSVAVTSDSMSFSNEHPLRLRDRRHNDISIRAHSKKSPAARHTRFMGYGYGYGGYGQDQFFILADEEPNCEPRALSVPQSPRSSSPSWPAVHRSKSSLGGMYPEILALRYGLPAPVGRQEEEELFSGVVLDDELIDDSDDWF
ncbi:hypothetical protein N7474_003535 [Penicillium riverlandense]|uniref:uncharacterized protein n=1 Tax=Penicillium riverlandense TaxID=1903569 RepID=UPI0025470E68|nr:uncharacterized protein N7474_003535 [Penicillium riverlandense]KAJ5826397.1 hypothetical protein N7474_003535 [Penicillium riverlandense]